MTPSAYGHSKNIASEKKIEILDDDSLKNAINQQIARI